MDPARAASALFDSPSRAFEVALWDGTVLPPPREAGVRGRVVLRHPRALSALLPPASERRLAEAFIAGDLELEGDSVGLLEAAARWQGPRLGRSLATAALSILARVRWSGYARPTAARVRRRGWKHSVGRDRAAVQHHYDVSDDFYRLFLDRGLVYSCAYFPTGAESLEEAQEAKLDLVCRKLALRPGERFLDVGCGWGALLEHAAQQYDVDGVGITLSEHQLAETRRRLAHLPGRTLSVVATDYRTLRPPAPFQKVASVGMMEHVGRARLASYFAAVHRLLAPGGLFLNHAIADGSVASEMIPWAHKRPGNGFMDRYIFPDHDLIPIGQVVTAAERAGFEVRDLECLREHYAETLAHWLARLEARFGEAVAQVGVRRARAYRLYLAGTQVAMRLGQISVFQLLLAKRAESGRVASVPRSRAEWYAPELRAAAAPSRPAAAAQRAPAEARPPAAPAPTANPAPPS